MKKIILSILGILTLSVSAQIKSQTIPWYSSGPQKLYDAHISNGIEWKSSEKKLEYTGSTWKHPSSILFGKDGGLSFATANVWSGSLPNFSSNKIIQKDFENNYVRMKLTARGSLGLGTINPKAKLHVDGVFGGYKSLILSNKKRQIFFTNYFSYNAKYSKSSIKGDFGIIFNDNIDGVNQNSGLVISPENNIHGLRMDAKGNVGIGTNLLSNQYNGSNDYFKLSVNGSIRAKEIVVETGWADFVFEDDYNLMSLEKVEDFIEENNHLPGLPSAKTITKNGLEVGAVQTIQMQKIEELTLYTIQQQKLIESLLTELKSIKADVATLKN
jgi:hypothetical protein